MRFFFVKWYNRKKRLVLHYFYDVIKKKYLSHVTIKKGIAKLLHYHQGQQTCNLLIECPQIHKPDGLKGTNFHKYISTYFHWNQALKE